MAKWENGTCFTPRFRDGRTSAPNYEFMRRRGTTNPGSMSNFSLSQPSLAFGLLSLLLFRPSGSNAESPRAGRPAKDESVRITAEATYIDHAPRLDGTLDDQLWQSAKVITDFRQREPNEGEPATEKTEVRILYTRHAVYFGIHCYDSVPSRIIATELRRDATTRWLQSTARQPGF